MAEGALLDLVCGPASPLPETYQRYRLVAHLGSGGQAEVYRAVRLCGGVSSAPMTVKVFRVDPQRPLVDELRSWDKGDAALMDLNNRGVAGICRRADGFYGPPPHRPGEPPQPGNAVPYQVYDYLHGINLREYIQQSGAGGGSGARGGAGVGTGIGKRLNAVAALRTLAGILRALHHPVEPGATPVLHMDVKPANVMVLATGEVRLIDFTGARYWRADEITRIAYTPESGGPEALSGQVGPPYDVHGLGSVAYFMVTGALPRAKNSRPLAAHPALANQAALRSILLAPLAERPGDRPSTLEMAGWVEQLAAVVRSAGVPEQGVDWAEPAPSTTSSRVVGRASVVSGTETDAFQRIERLERELVELRGAFSADRFGSAGPLLATAAYVAHPMPGVPNPPTKAAIGTELPYTTREPYATREPHAMKEPRSAEEPLHRTLPRTQEAANGAALGAEPPVNPNGGLMRGRASVVTKPTGNADPTAVPLAPQPEQPRYRPPLRDTVRQLKRGGGWTWFGAIVAFLCWCIWAASNRGGDLLYQFSQFILALIVAGGLFALQRLVGRMVIVRLFGKQRQSAWLSHLGTGVFLVIVGAAFLRQTSWIVHLIAG